jgi:hypothetical protein
MFMSPNVSATCDTDTSHRGNPEQDAYAFVLQVARDLIASGRVLPQYRDPDLVAQIAWAGLHGVIALHIDNGGDPWVNWKPAAETAMAMGDVILRGLCRG